MIYFIAALLGWANPVASANTGAARFIFQQMEIKSDSSHACQLKQFTVFNARTSDGSDGETSMAAAIETTGPECVQNYAIVQWVHGCVYQQELDLSTNQLSATKEYLRYQNRGDSIDFHLSDWTVDSRNADPFIASKTTGAGGGRLGWYYVPKQPLNLQNNLASLQADQAQVDDLNSRYFLQDASSLEPTQVYVSDRPTSAQQVFDSANNASIIETPSLDFETCVYDIQDVPPVGDPAAPTVSHAQGGPIACYAWSHKFEYQLSSHTFKRVISSGVDLFCQ